jgi:hypothetical protein
MEAFETSSEAEAFQESLVYYGQVANYTSCMSVS